MRRSDHIHLRGIFWTFDTLDGNEVNWRGILEVNKTMGLLRWDTLDIFL